MRKQDSIKIITLKDLWQIFVKKLGFIILSVLLGVGAVYGYEMVTFMPEYESTATLYILRQNNQGQTDSNISSDFSMALNVVNDCTYLLKGHAVVDEVIDRLGLNISYQQLYKNISTRNPDNTRILEVTVKSSTAEQAKQIVDELCKIGADNIEDAMGFRQVNVYEKGILNYAPCNQISLVTYILIGIIVGVFMYIIFLIQFLLDDVLRTNEDIEKYLGLTVLGNIPCRTQSSKKHYGYYGKSKK